MSTPNFDKGSGGPDPYGPPGGQPSGSAPGYGQPPGGASPFGQPAGGSPYGQPGGYGSPPPYGQPAGYGAPAPYGSGSGVVGPGGEWLGPPLASWGARVGSYLIDVVLLGVVVFLVALVSPDLSTLFNIAGVLVLGFLNGSTGQTPGKKAVGIKLLKVADGQVLGGPLGIARQFLHILDGLPLLLGYLWPLWDKKNQTFADKIVGSVVIKL